MPVAGAFTRELQTGKRVVALFSRDVADFVVVSSPNEASFPPGTLMQRQAYRYEGPGVFNGLTLEQVCDSSLPARGSVKATLKLDEDLPTSELIAEGVRHLVKEIESTGVRTGGTLYLSGKMPVASEAALQDAAKDLFDRVAVFVPGHPGEDRYLCVSSESGVWLPEPCPLHLLKELDAIPVTPFSTGSDVLLTLVGDPEYQAGTNQLVQEVVQRVEVGRVFKEGGDILYLNGKIPIAVAASVASKAFHFDSFVVFIPQHPGEDKYLISDSTSGASVGTFLPHPHPTASSLPIDEMLINVLGRARRIRP